MMKVNLALDFDSTLTTTDTLTALSSLSTSPSPSPWQPFVEAYTAELATHNSTQPHPHPRDRTTLSHEIAYLSNLEPIERASFERVRDSGLFDGVSFDVMQAATTRLISSGEVSFRRGWEELLRFCLARGGGLAIVSVNFSAAFVWCCVQAAWRGVRREGEVEVLPVHVWANEATPAVAEGAGGYLHTEGWLHTVKHKERVYLKEIMGSRKMREGGAEGEGVWDSVEVFVGDSPTDLLCMLRADLGISIRPGEMRSAQKDFQGVCERTGIINRYIGEAKWEDFVVSDGSAHTRITELSELGKRGIWHATDFAEILSKLCETLDDEA